MSKIPTTNSSTAATLRPGSVSVVIVNYRGSEDTIDCIRHVRTLDWPAENLQIVVIDNASGDDSVTRIRAAAPDVTLVDSNENSGFAGGCNLGVAHSHGEFIAFINSDARPHPQWVRAAVAELTEHADVGAVASKVLDWDGKLIDYVGGSINFTGQGYKLEAGDRDLGEFETPKDVLFPTGSAAVFRTSVFTGLGGFDEQFFMFFEDVDLGWRINLAGLRVRYLPNSIVYHRHHASIKKFGSYREQYLLARNALVTIYKNFSDETLAKVLAPALLLAVHNGVLLGEADAAELDLQRSPGGDDVPTLELNKLTMTGAYAVEYLTRNLPALTEQRREIQRSRVRSDAGLAKLFGDLLKPTSPVAEYHAAWINAINSFGLSDGVLRRTRVAVVTADTLSKQMAGPAIRAFHIAETLADDNDVKLVSTTRCTLDTAEFECSQVTDKQLRSVVAWSDIVVFQGYVMHQAPWLAESGKIIVVDIYDPMHLEQLEQSKADEPNTRAAHIAATTQALNNQLLRGDFFLCASEEQRHFWLGQLAAVGRLNPANYDRDSSLRSLLTVSPFGLPGHQPERTRNAIKGVVPGIALEDKVILWGGGVYNWFDPLTLIRAVDRVRKEHDDVRLFFLGMKHPNPNVPEMRMAWDARQLADELGLTDVHVFFNEGWVDYDDRQNYLLDADLGVSTHFEHVETTFSFRTRMLDYLWAGLPIVATGGDVFGRLITAEGLGVTVHERDVDALSAGIEKSLYNKEFVDVCRGNVARVRAQFTWQSTLAPLVEFCRDPTRAPDVYFGNEVLPLSPALPVPYGKLARNLSYAKQRYREGGVAFVAERALVKAKRISRRGSSN
jgi:GT2 family glycosyltransferase